MPDEVTSVPPIEDADRTFLDTSLRRSYLEEAPSLIGSIVSTGSTFPSSPSTGQLFFRTDTNKLYVYIGTAWRQVNVLDEKGNSKIPGGKYLKG